MKNVIKEFEKILYSSLVYYPEEGKNKGSTFKVILPELYYDKFRELNTEQKEIITKFINIFLKRLKESEDINIQAIKDGILNLKYNNTYFLNKQNILDYLIEFFGESIDPYRDIKIIPDTSYNVPIEGNRIGYNRFENFIGAYLPLKNLCCDVAVRIHSDHLRKIVQFMKKHKLGMGVIGVSEPMILFYTVRFFDGKITLLRKSFDEEIRHFN